MTKSDKKNELSERQKKAIPFLVQSSTIEDGCMAAKISRETYYQWFSDPMFKDDLKRQRDQVIEDALNVMKSNATKAVDVLVALLGTKNDNLRRYVANDILAHVLKAKEIDDLEARITEIERLIKEKKP
ncbi:MAG: phBC6A51 family helix-turn-helix protein [Deltaproteobacteria bacterium]|nr:phBC6A51 family helix-turn-helix protein [Deltaproteobacteria bacterium]